MIGLPMHRLETKSPPVTIPIVASEAEIIDHYRTALNAAVRIKQGNDVTMQSHGRHGGVVSGYKKRAILQYAVYLVNATDEPAAIKVQLVDYALDRVDMNRIEKTFKARLPKVPLTDSQQLIGEKIRLKVRAFLQRLNSFNS